MKQTTISQCAKKQAQKLNDACSSISRVTGRSKSRTGEGTAHCLHPDCAGFLPITNKKRHTSSLKTHTEFQECKQNCDLCRQRSELTKNRHVKKPCSKCGQLKRSDKLKNHVKNCKGQKSERNSNLPLFDASQSVDNISDEDFEGFDSLSVGNKRSSRQSVEQLHQDVIQEEKYGQNHQSSIVPQQRQYTCSAQDPLKKEFDQMMSETSVVFMNHFFTVASEYTHIDLKRSIKQPYKYKEHFTAQLSLALEQELDEQSLPFVLGVACLLGGKLFLRIPSIIRRLEQKKVTSTYSVTEVMSCFYPVTIATELAKSYKSISVNTESLVQALVHWPNTLKIEVVTACFDLLPLTVNVDERGFKEFICTCIFASKLACYPLLRSVAISGVMFPQEQLADLVTYASDPYIDEQIIEKSDKLAEKPLSQWKDYLLKVRSQDYIECCRTMTQHDSKIETRMKNQPKNFNVILQLMKEADIALSCCQASTSKHCIIEAGENRRTLWRVGAGMGKSHLIMCVALYLLKYEQKSVIYICYPSDELQEKDSHLIASVQQLSQAKNRIKIVIANEKKNISPKENDYVLVDECDEVYFSNLAWFEQKMKLATVVGFTASPPLEQEEFETMLLTKFFSKSIIDSKLSLRSKEGQKGQNITEPILIEQETVIDKLKSREMPALVFCTSKYLSELCAALKESKKAVYVNNCSKDLIEHLDDLETLNLKEFPILLVDNVHLMRGHNYRSKRGIMLILCRGFKCKRDATQAKGRVGRYNDSCSRYQTIDELVDTKLLQEYLGQLFKFVKDV